MLHAMIKIQSVCIVIHKNDYCLLAKETTAEFVFWTSIFSLGMAARDGEGENSNSHHRQAHTEMLRVQKVKKGSHYFLKVLLQELFSLLLEDLPLW